MIYNRRQHNAIELYSSTDNTYHQSNWIGLALMAFLLFLTQHYTQFHFYSEVSIHRYPVG